MQVLNNVYKFALMAIKITIYIAFSLNTVERFYFAQNPWDSYSFVDS